MTYLMGNFNPEPELTMHFQKELCLILSECNMFSPPEGLLASNCWTSYSIRTELLQETNISNINLLMIYHRSNNKGTPSRRLGSGSGNIEDLPLASNHHTTKEHKI